MSIDQLHLGTFLARSTAELTAALEVKKMTGRKRRNLKAAKEIVERLTLLLKGNEIRLLNKEAAAGLLIQIEEIGELPKQQRISATCSLFAGIASLGSM